MISRNSRSSNRSAEAAIAAIAIVQAWLLVAVIGGLYRTEAFRGGLILGAVSGAAVGLVSMRASIRLARDLAAFVLLVLLPGIAVFRVPEAGIGWFLAGAITAFGVTAWVQDREGPVETRAKKYASFRLYSAGKPMDGLAVSAGLILAVFALAPKGPGPLLLAGVAGGLAVGLESLRKILDRIRRLGGEATFAPRFWPRYAMALAPIGIGLAVGGVLVAGATSLGARKPWDAGGAFTLPLSPLGLSPLGGMTNETAHVAPNVTTWIILAATIVAVLGLGLLARKPFGRLVEVAGQVLAAQVQRIRLRRHDRRVEAIARRLPDPLADPRADSTMAEIYRSWTEHLRLLGAEGRAQEGVRSFCYRLEQDRVMPAAPIRRIAKTFSDAAYGAGAVSEEERAAAVEIVLEFNAQTRQKFGAEQLEDKRRNRLRNLAAREYAASKGRQRPTIQP